MTILAQIAQTAYQKSVQTFNATVPSGLTKLSISLTRVSWPSGQLALVEFTLPDGVTQGPAVAIDGGQILAQGSKAASQAVFQLNWVILTGIVSGVYAVKVTIYQAATTAITVEGF